MDLQFEKGTREAPKGHALVYFYKQGDPESVLATYLVTLPVSVDVAKYIPPMLAPQLQGAGVQELSGFAFPPLPESVESLDLVRHLAEVRDDDLIYGGTGDPDNPMDFLQTVSEMQQEYTQLYQRNLDQQALPALSTVSDLLYEIMGERDKLNELSKLMGKLRFAAEGSDTSGIKETEEEISTLARYLPERYKISKLVDVAEMPATVGALLAQLYLERCYRLYEEDYRRLQELEEEIGTMEAGLES